MDGSPTTCNKIFASSAFHYRWWLRAKLSHCQMHTSRWSLCEYSGPDKFLHVKPRMSQRVRC